MLISIIVAVGKNGVIGYQGKLPWHLPADLKYFKNKTLGKPVIMGRQTYISIGRLLPNRLNIILSSDKTLQIPGAIIAHSLGEAIEQASSATSSEIMIIGGAKLFGEALPLVSRIYITYIHAEFQGDCYFPRLDQAQWREIAREDHAPDEQNPYSYSFAALERV